MVENNKKFFTPKAFSESSGSSLPDWVEIKRKITGLKYAIINVADA